PKRKVLLISVIFWLIILALIFLPEKALALDMPLEQQLQQEFIKRSWTYILGLLNIVVVLGLIVV
ncbi:unnamed protein product, partial [marine sediment metagenome]